MMMMVTKNRLNGRRTPSVPVLRLMCTLVFSISIMISSTRAQNDHLQIGDAYLSVPAATPTTPSADSTSDYLRTQNVELEHFNLLECMSVSPQIVKCAANVYLTYLYHHIPLDIVSSCCEVIFKVGEKCLPKFNLPKIESRHFDFLNNLPNQLKQLCELTQSLSSASSTSSTRLSVPSSDASRGLTLPSKQDGDLFGECLFSNLRSVEKCEQEVVTFFTTLQVQSIGKSCCKAILDIGEACWSSVFPFNPLFPSMLKNYCMTLSALPPSP